MFFYSHANKRHYPPQKSVALSLVLRNGQNSMNTPISQYPSYAHLHVPIAMAALAVKMSTSKTVINSALFTVKNFFPRQNFIFFEHKALQALATLKNTLSGFQGYRNFLKPIKRQLKY